MGTASSDQTFVMSSAEALSFLLVTAPITTAVEMRAWSKTYRTFLFTLSFGIYGDNEATLHYEAICTPKLNTEDVAEQGGTDNQVGAHDALFYFRISIQTNATDIALRCPGSLILSITLTWVQMIGATLIVLALLALKAAVGKL
jgi:hypothetical protein